MPIEIERKFLVDAQLWQPQGSASHYRQGYVCISEKRVVRVRIADQSAYLTLKGALPGSSIARLEYEYPIPLADAEEMLARLCPLSPIDKVRYRFHHGQQLWEVDIFVGANSGLILAEVELIHIDQVVELPPWIDREVTEDPRYSNAYLSQHPYNLWPEQKE